jgi:hypothetical protein
MRGQNFSLPTALTLLAVALCGCTSTLTSFRRTIPDGSYGPNPEIMWWAGSVIEVQKTNYMCRYFSDELSHITPPSTGKIRREHGRFVFEGQGGGTNALVVGRVRGYTVLGTKEEIQKERKSPNNDSSLLYHYPKPKPLPPIAQFPDGPLVQAISHLADQLDLNYIFDPHVPSAPKRPITSQYAASRSQRQALNELLRDNDLVMVENPATTIVRFVPARLRIKPIPSSQVGTNLDSVIPKLRFDDCPLSDVIKNLTRQVGMYTYPKDLSFLRTRGLETDISITWHDITGGQALAALLDNYGLVMKQAPGDEAVRIEPCRHTVTTSIRLRTPADSL